MAKKQPDQNSDFISKTVLEAGKMGKKVTEALAVQLINSLKKQNIFGITGYRIIDDITGKNNSVGWPGKDNENDWYEISPYSSKVGISVLLIIAANKDGKYHVLLGKKKEYGDYRLLPGGFFHGKPSGRTDVEIDNYDKSLRETAIREAIEETGLEFLKNIRPEFVGEPLSDDELFRRMKADYHAHFMLLDLGKVDTIPTPRANSDINELYWADINDLRNDVLPIHAEYISLAAIMLTNS